ncbi:MAG: hypothetical protein RJA70_522 [Pseudomonadota bacterium]|jgi:hypothetical protein
MGNQAGVFGVRCGAALGVLLASVVGCSGANVAGKHAKFHGCSDDDVVVTEVPSEGHTQLVTKGCGAEETYYCIGMKCRSPRLLAISEFSVAKKCKEQEVKTTTEDGYTFKLQGCQERATYVCEQVPNDVIRCSPKKK